MKMGPSLFLFMTFMVCSKAAFHLYDDIILTWDESQTQCSDQGMSLAVLKTEEDYTQAKHFIVSKIGALEIKIFIGLYYDIEKGVFLWTDDTLLTYDKWGIDQPMDTKTYRCIRLSKDFREFESDMCDTKRNFLCSDNGTELSSQPTSEPFITEILKSEPTIKLSTETDISSTPMTTEKLTFPLVTTTQRTDVSIYTGAGLSSQPKSETTVKQSSSTQTSIDDITSLSPLGLQTTENNILSSIPMTTANEMFPLVSIQRTDVSSAKVTSNQTTEAFVTKAISQVATAKQSSSANILTRTRRTDVATESLCPCKGVMYSNKTSVINDIQVEEMKRRIKKELTVDKKTLSSTRNKRLSAHDDRISSKCIGLVGVCVLVTVVSLFAASDIMSCVQ